MQQDNLLTNENEAAANVPEKFRDAETGKIRLDRLLQSYQELERKLSSSSAPKIPASADDYKIELPDPAMEMDAEVNARLHEKGFTQEQVQEVYNLAAAKLMPVMQAMVAEFEADQEIENWLPNLAALKNGRKSRARCSLLARKTWRRMCLKIWRLHTKGSWRFTK